MVQVFHRTSRINHSCVPNAQGNFDDTLSRFNIHATRDIKTDEELTLNYLVERGAERASRQSELLTRYGFACDCPACDMKSARGRAGERRRLQVQKELRAYVEDGAQSPEMRFQITRSFIQLLEGEDIVGRELSTL